MADAANPNNIGGQNEYANLDGSGTAGPIGITLEAGGNTVNRNRIVKPLNVLDKNETAAKPLGQSGTTGF